MNDHSAPRGRALALDLGERRIGVAICDDKRLVATPLDTIHRVGDRLIEHGRIRDLVEENEIVVVVVGLPLSLNGDLGPAARKVLSEVKGLRKRIGVEVVTYDERLSTIDAENSLRAQGVNSRKGRKVVDQLAASVILQAWIEANR